MKIGITGHRPPRLKGQEKLIEHWIEEQLINLRAVYKDIILVTGMAAGVDQIAALAAIKLGVGVECFFPYRHKLSMTEKYIVENAAEVRYFAEQYPGKGVYLNRDRALVEESDLLLVVFDGRPLGGTHYTFEYAKTLGKNIMNFPWGISS
jgi:predicted Rossmann fold nucleotide-binding protein DprA/Smf involved in DNA uptake